MSTSRQDAGVVYHYTGPDGLLSMLTTGHLWATDAAYMNDPNELRYGYDRLADLASRTPAYRRVHARLRQIVDYVAQEKISNGRVYLASFCEDGDLLSQWRAYGAFGGGFAIGLLRTSLLGNEENEKPPARVLSPVLYERRRQDRILLGWLRKYVQKQKWDDGVIEYELLDLFWRHLMAFKHPSYSEEKEWRLIQFGREVPMDGTPEKILWPPRFRVRKDGIVSYGDIDLTQSEGPLHGKLPVVEIVCGPSVHRERGMKAIRQLAVSLGFEVADGEGRFANHRTRPRLKIRPSRAPFSG